MLRRGYRVVYRIRRHMRYTLIPHITLTLELNVKLLLLKILLLLTLTVFNSITLLFLNVTQLYQEMPNENSRFPRRTLLVVS